MNTFSKTVLVAVSAISLASCANHDKEKQISAQQLVDEQIHIQAINIELAQNELYQAGAINRTRYKFPSYISANSQSVIVNWQGDAYELLAQMAKQRGLRFNSQGVKLPLPVNINVQGATFENLLALVRMQTQYRAVITQRAASLDLLYLTPKKERSNLIRR